MNLGKFLVFNSAQVHEEAKLSTSLELNSA